MKKTLVLIVLATVLFSCKKSDNAKCWTCNVNNNIVIECNKTRSQINEEIKDTYIIMHNDSAHFFMECH